MKNTILSLNFKLSNNLGNSFLILSLIHFRYFKFKNTKKTVWNSVSDFILLRERTVILLRNC